MCLLSIRKLRLNREKTSCERRLVTESEMKMECSCNLTSSTPLFKIRRNKLTSQGQVYSNLKMQ